MAPSFIPSKTVAVYPDLSNTGALSLMSVMATVMFIVFVENPSVTLSNKQTVKAF